MANNKDFILKNAIEIGGSTKVTIGDAPVLANVLRYSDVSDWTHSSVYFSVSGQSTAPFSVAFNNTGTKMYIVSDAPSDSIYQYSLSTAFDVSTASSDSVARSVAGQGGQAREIRFNNNGTKLYSVDSGTDKIHQYSLSTAFDLSTISYNNVSLDISGQATIPSSLAFNNDGTKVFVLDYGNKTLFEYDMSTGFDLSTTQYNNVNFNLTSYDTQARSFDFNGDGTKLYFLGAASDTIYQFSLSSGFDLSTVSDDSISLSVANEDTIPVGLTVIHSEQKAYIIGGANDTIYQYTTASTVSTATFDASTGNYFTHTPSADAEYGFSNVGDVQTFQLEVTPSATITITWDENIEWGFGTAPDSPAASEKDLYTITTDDGGTTYVGVQSGDNFS